jgi:hypothetical protein
VRVGEDKRTGCTVEGRLVGAGVIEVECVASEKTAGGYVLFCNPRTLILYLQCCALGAAFLLKKRDRYFMPSWHEFNLSGALLLAMQAIVVHYQRTSDPQSAAVVGDRIEGVGPADRNIDKSVEQQGEVFRPKAHGESEIFRCASLHGGESTELRQLVPDAFVI